MLKHNHLASLMLLALLMLTLPLSAAKKPDIMLAKKFHSTLSVSEYWISEKLDGMRAHWNGRQLISRGGTIISAPPWFTQGFPSTELDGELWIARGAYQETISIVRKKEPLPEWGKVKFMLFDLPKHKGKFTQRIERMRTITKESDSPYLVMIPQFRLASHKELTQHLNTITGQGAEGLMLHHQGAYYREGRSNKLLKLKIFSDAEATVLGYRAGKGKLTGKLGSLKVKNQQGKIFYIGSGFNNEERISPPTIGSIITYKYQGLTDSGLPRFAVFLRVRNEQ